MLQTVQHSDSNRRAETSHNCVYKPYWKRSDLVMQTYCLTKSGGHIKLNGDEYSDDRTGEIKFFTFSRTGLSTLSYNKSNAIFSCFISSIPERVPWLVVPATATEDISLSMFENLVPENLSYHQRCTKHTLIFGINEWVLRRQDGVEIWLGGEVVLLT